MSQADCTAEVEAWLVRNNFTEPQRAHLLQQVDALSDFSEAVDEDIPAITAGWSSLARSKLRRCVAKLCAERGWECKLAAAAPALGCFPHWIIQFSRAAGCRPWCSFARRRASGIICNRFLQRAAVAAPSARDQFRLLC